jgi:hypothetical protein
MKASHLNVRPTPKRFCKGRCLPAVVRLILPAVLLLVLPGCLGLLEKAPCPSPEGWVLGGPFDAKGNIAAFPETGPYNRLLYFLQNPTDESAELRFVLRYPAGSVDQGTSTHFAGPEAVTPGNGSIMGSATPPLQAAANASATQWDYVAELGLRSETCGLPGTKPIPLTFETRPPGEAASPGHGVQVLTAGFWTNGTLFYTNMQRVHDDPQLRRAGWYEWEGADPLLVYVYNETRTEIPPRYNASGFVTTIPGFNAALKTIFVGTSFVAYLPPEAAYTRPGNEAHPLFGDPLVFYIEITDVVAVPCPYPQPLCELPSAPATAPPFVG